MYSQWLLFCLFFQNLWRSCWANCSSFLPNQPEVGSFIKDGHYTKPFWSAVTSWFIEVCSGILFTQTFFTQTFNTDWRSEWLTVVRLKPPIEEFSPLASMQCTGILHLIYYSTTLKQICLFRNTMWPVECSQDCSAITNTTTREYFSRRNRLS